MLSLFSVGAWRSAVWSMVVLLITSLAAGQEQKVPAKPAPAADASAPTSPVPVKPAVAKPPAAAPSPAPSAAPSATPSATPSTPSTAPAPAKRAPKAPTPRAAAEPASPSDAKPAARAAAKRIKLPTFDLSRLAHPDVAAALELTDQQRARVVQLLTERADQLAKATPKQRKSISRETDQKLAAVLSAEQRARLGTLSGAHKLHFNFREQKWADVLDWFARQAGLSLVMDQMPSGSFTYSDTRGYSPTEAIDLLNSVLLTKGMTLVRNDRMLVLVDLTKEPSRNLLPRVSIDEIPSHGRFEVISALFPLGRRPADTVVKEIQPLMGDYGKCIALPQTGQIMVTETAGKLQAISTLLASIPEPAVPKKKPETKPVKPVPPILGVYAAGTIDPNAAVITLAQLFPAAKFTVDDKADQILAYARPNEQTAIKGAVDLMTANRAPDLMARLDVYPLDGVDQEQLEKQLAVVVPKAQAMVDAAKSRLLVFAEPKDQEAVKETLKKLGADLSFGTRKVVVYRVTHVTPDTLATLVTQLMPAARVTTDLKIGGVVINASESEHAVIKEMVSQLDQATPKDGQPQLHVYSVDRPVDANLLTSLQGLFPDAQVSSSTDARQLIVVARPDDQTRISEWVDQWKVVAGQLQEPELKTYPLKAPLNPTLLATLQTMVPNARLSLSTDGRQMLVVGLAADQVVVEKTLKQVESVEQAAGDKQLEFYQVKGMAAAELQSLLQPVIERATVTVDPTQDRLIVWGPASEHEAIAKVIEKLGTEPLASNKPEIRFYEVSDATLSERIVAALLTLAPAAKPTWDAEVKRLMVIATPRDHEVVKQTIDQIIKDVVPAAKAELKVYALGPVQRARFDVLQPDLLQKMPGMRIIPDPQTGELAIWAKPDQHAELAKIIKQLTTDAPAGGGPVLIAYPLEHATPQVVFDMLVSLYPTVRFTLDEKGRRIVAVAPLPQQAQVKQSIAQLDIKASREEEEELRSYAFGTIDPTPLMTIFQTLVPDMKLTLDTRAGKIIAWGLPRDHEKLKKTMDQFRTGEVENRPVVKSYLVPGRDASALLRLMRVLAQVVPEAILAVDAEAHSIVASARSEQHKLLQEAIDQVVKMDGMAAERLETYTLESITPLHAVMMLRAITPDARAAPGVDPRQVVVWASDADHVRIAAALKKMEETAGEKTDRVLRVHRVNRNVATQLTGLVTTAIPGLQVVTGQGTERLLAWGSEKDHAHLDDLIKRLEQEMGVDQPRQMVVYDLEGMTATEARRVLEQALGTLEYIATDSTEQLIIWADSKQHEQIKKVLDELKLVAKRPEETIKVYKLDDELDATTLYNALTAEDQQGLSIQVSTPTNSLIVRGSAKRQEQFEKIIEQLKKELPKKEQVETRLYRMKHADPSPLSTILQRLVPTASIMVDSRARSLAITATVKEHQRLKEVIDQVDAPGQDQQQTTVYKLKAANPLSLRAALMPMVPDATIGYDTTGKLLIITATKEQHLRIKQIIEQADQDVGEGMVTKVYRLKVANPYTLHTALVPLLPNALIGYDTTSKSLVITATEQQHARIQEIIDQADKPGDDGLTTEVYKLVTANPITIRTMVLPLVPAATISYDVGAKLLIATASKEDHLRIKAVIEKADRQNEGELVTEFYTLKYANPYTLSQSLQKLIPDALLTPDITSKKLIVTALAKDQERIKAVIERADQKDDRGEVTEVYTLKVANPLTLYTALRPLVPDAKIGYDTTGKSLIVTAVAADQELIKQVIDKADRKDEGELTTEVYALKFANPYYLLTALKPLVPNALMSPDTTNKKLLVTATAVDQKRIQDVIEQADVAADSDMTTEIYEVKVANPATLAGAITPLAPTAHVSFDVLGKTLIVTATLEDQQRIKSLIEKADRQGEGETLTKVYALEHADPYYLSTALKTLVPGAAIVADRVNKKLIVTATEKDQQQVDEVVKQADVAADSGMVTEVYTLKVANPATLAAAIRPLAPTARIGSDTIGKTLIVTAKQEDQDRIKAVVEKADRQGEGETSTKVYALEHADPYYLSTALKTLVPGAAIVYDQVNKKLIVTATEKDQQQVDEVVKQADVAADSGMVTEVYTLKIANPATLAAAIRPLAPTARIGSDTIGKTLIVTAKQEDQDRIKAVVEKADRQGEGETSTKVYALEHADPYYLSTALKTLVPGASIVYDQKNKKLIITATTKDQQQVDEVVKQADVAADSGMVTEVYTLKVANPTTLAAAIRPLVPTALIGSDTIGKTLIVTAKQEDQVRIKAVVEKADRQGEGETSTQVYALKYADPYYLSTALQTLVPGALITADRVNKKLLVTAIEKDQKRIEAVVKQADIAADSGLVTEVYSLTMANPATLAVAIRPLVPDARVGFDATGKTLIVTAAPEDQVRIKAIVEKADRRDEGGVVTKVYALKLADPRSALVALRPLLPGATMSADSSTNTLIVTASEKSQTEVESIVKGLDVEDPNAVVLRTYSVANADPEDVYQSLSTLYRLDRTINVGYQASTGMILVTAPVTDQEDVAKAIEDIDKATASRDKTTLEVYSLTGLDGSAAVGTLEALMINETPKVDLQFDFSNNQVLAVADPTQHQMIRKALDQLKPEEREVEVFTLKSVDPFAAQTAIESMFTDLPLASSPSVDADPGTQQLFIRATKPQMERIRELLEKMGEDSKAGGRRGSDRMMRVVPYSGDLDETLRQIQRIWPQLRGNEIQILTQPGTRGTRDRTEKNSTGKATGNRPSGRPTGTEQQPGTGTPAKPGKSSEPSSDSKAPRVGQLDNLQSGAEWWVSAPAAPIAVDEQPAKPPAAAVPSKAAMPAGKPAQVPPAAVPTTPANGAANAQTFPPVVIIPGAGRLTIASRDSEALNQLEELLGAMQRRRLTATSGNYSIFVLHNTAAKEVAATLTDLFRQRRSSRSSSYGSRRRSSRQQVSVVADERMNAIMVFGTPADRGVVEDMLQVLDSVEAPELLTTEKPRMIPIKNLPAQTVLDILTSVYRTHLQMQRGFKSISIPRGISSEMVSLLQQVNAAAATPVLTLDMDKTTNSIVMRAPLELGQEIEEFVQELDEKATEGGTQSIRLIMLKKMNSTQADQAIRMLMGRGSSRGSSRGYRSGYSGRSSRGRRP